MTYVLFGEKEEKINMNTFLKLITELRTQNQAVSNNPSLWNRRKVKKAQKKLDKYIAACARTEAENYFNQVVEFYKDLAKHNLV